MAKIPFYRQKSSNECGPTCIQMISAYYGKHYNIDTILKYAELTKGGISVKDVVNIGESIGFYTHSFSANIDEARRIPVPSILYLQHGHFVILEDIKLKADIYYYHLLDPDYGRVKLTEPEFTDKWMNNGRGFGVVLAPKDDFFKINPKTNFKTNNKEMYADIKSVVKKYKSNFILIAFFTLLILIANWAMPLILKKTIDDGIINKDIGFVWLMLFTQFLFFLGFIISNIITNYLSAKVSFKINVNYIKRYLNKLINLPLSFFDTTFKSDLIQRLSDLNRINDFITEHIIDILFSIVNLIVFSTILIVYNLNIFLLFLAFSIVSIIYTFLFLKKRRHLDYSFFTLDSERRNSIYELIMGMHEVKINDAQESRIKSWNRVEEKLNKLKMKKIWLDNYLSNGYSIISRLRDIVLTAFSAFYVIQDEMTIGTMMMISYVLGQLSGPINDIITFSKIFQDLKLSYERLFKIYKKNDENKDKNIVFEKKLEKGIIFKNVYFKYPGISNPYILENININIPVGKTTAIVGPSGGGKTTILKLILGFYEPTKGHILIDDNILTEINLNSWREQCGVVMQNGYIFSGSIGENIALKDQSPNIEQLIYSSKLANLTDFINMLPMKYNTKIGESGIDLSGGEKQRICIARAIYKNPNIILFDEATSSLDANNEKEIVNNIYAYFKNRTAVIIAHRLSTVKNADNIIFLDERNVIEQGKHEDLISAKGAYYQLVKNQL